MWFRLFLKNYLGFVHSIWPQHFTRLSWINLHPVVRSVRTVRIWRQGSSQAGLRCSWKNGCLCSTRAVTQLAKNTTSGVMIPLPWRKLLRMLTYKCNRIQPSLWQQLSSPAVAASPPPPFPLPLQAWTMHGVAPKWCECSVLSQPSDKFILLPSSVNYRHLRLPVICLFLPQKVATDKREVPWEAAGDHNHLSYQCFICYICMSICEN